jgi:hypothetical protein
MPSNETTKIILINWKWESMQPINAEVYQKQTPKEWKERIAQNDPTIFQTYEAESSYHKQAIVVACSIFQPAETVLVETIQHLYNSHVQPEVYLFLHRGNHYAGEHLINIMNEVDKKVSKIFLFGYGSNYIYYNSQKKGFLDESGDFFSGRDKDTKQKIVTYDTDTQKLKSPYFDDVWHHYEHEFDHKIQEFEQDLFDVLAHFAMPDGVEQYTKGEFLKLFKEYCDQQGKEMCYRIKSFWGAYDELPEGTNSAAYDEYTQLKKEREAIIELEKKRFTAYLLDDFLASVKHIDETDETDRKISEKYSEVLEPALRDMFSTTKQEPVTVEQIRKLQEDFATFRELFQKNNHHLSNQTSAP